MDVEHSLNSLSPSAISALREGNKIEAIKLVRQEKGIGLKEAKNLVDACLRTDPDVQAKLAAVQTGAARNALWWLVAFVAVVAGLYVVIARPWG